MAKGAPVLALLHLLATSHACTENCLCNDKCSNKWEYGTHRLLSKSVKFVRFWKKKSQTYKICLIICWSLLSKMNFYIQENLLSSRAYLPGCHYFSVALQQRSTGKLLALSEFMPQHFIDVVKKEGVWLAGAFLKEYTAKQSCCFSSFNWLMSLKKIPVCLGTEWDIILLQMFCVQVQLFCWLKWDNGSIASHHEPNVGYLICL